MSTFKSLADTVMAHCDMLATISQSIHYLDRRYLTKQHALCNEQVAQWMQDAGMNTWQDDAGNLFGRYKSDKPDAKSLVIGSHLDTVINGGKYDGMLGVLAPISIISLLNDQKKHFPFHIDIVGFGDEEGTRFGSTLLGCRALTGQWQSHWAHLKDNNGITLRQAMQEFGLNFDDIENSKLNPSDLLAYFELHIEQGPVLEQHDLPVGIVSAIAGARRINVEVSGMAGHAGTVPMAIRQDALAGVSEMILAVEKIASEYHVVATVGKIDNSPNAVNVISGKTTFTIDIRSDNDDKRDHCLALIMQEISKIAERRQLLLNTQETHRASAVLCDQTLINTLTEAVKKAGISPLQLFSGAGHDAMGMAEICPVTMLFTRCEGGISHNPAEAITVADVAHSLEVFYLFLEEFAENEYEDEKRMQM